jgi:transposase
MLGTKTRNFAPLVNVSLEELVPADHFYRQLEQKLDLSFVRELTRKSYAHGGRPSIDPMVFFKLQLVMFFDGIRSERQLMQLSADRLSVRWYLGYDLSEPLPDHSSLTRIRGRYGIEIFRRFFEAITSQCQQAGLVWGKELYLDSTQMQANASVASLKARFAIEAHLSRLFSEEGEAQQSPPAKDEVGDGEAPYDLASHKDGHQTNHVPQEAEPCSPASLPVDISPSREEELAQVQRQRHNWIERLGRPEHPEDGQAQRISDFRLSTTDPDATLMPTEHLGYKTHYVVDGGKARTILAVLVTPSEVKDNQPALDLLSHARFRWKVRPEQVTADTVYGTVENISALEREHIRAYIPLAAYESRTSLYGKQAFRYDRVQDVYICPNNQRLPLSKIAYTEREKRYRADPALCDACRLKARCTTSDQGRQIKRSFDEEYVERVRSYQQTEAYKKAIRKRSVWVEPLFAEGKDWHGMRRFRLRRLWKVNIEALMRAAGQNLKRLLKKRGSSRHPWPEGAENALLFGIFQRFFPQRKRQGLFVQLFLLHC